MTKQTRWSLVSALSGAAVAAVLVLVFDLDLALAVIFVGVWIVAGSVLRFLLEYRRVSREVEREG